VNKQTLLLSCIAALGAPTLAVADVQQPVEIIDRSRTLPASTLELAANLAFTRIVPAMGDGRTVTDLGVSAGYGFTPALEGRIGYGLGLDPSSGRGPLVIGGAFDLLKAANLTAALDLFTGYHVGVEELLPLQIGVEAQLKLTDTLAVFTPGHQLAIGLSGDNPIGLHLPIGLGFQAAPRVFVDVQTEIAYLGFRGGNGRLFGDDHVPLRLEGFYSPSNAFDLGLWLSDDLKQAADAYQLGVSARLFL